MKMHISITAGIYSVYPVVFKVLVDLIVFMSLLFKLCPLTCFKSLVDCPDMRFFSLRGYGCFPY